MPTAFIAKSDEDGEVAALWTEVWEDSGSTAQSAVRLYMADIVPLVLAGVFLHDASIRSILSGLDCSLCATHE